MIVLSQTTDKLQAVLAGAVTANQLQCVTSWRDRTSTTFVADRTVTLTNSDTDVDLVGSPAASTQRIIDFISIYQNDTANVTLTVKLDANGTEYILWKGLLAVGERLEYTDDKGFQVYNSAGAVKVSQYLGSQNAIVGAFTTVLSTENTVNNNVSANTLSDVTGLSFAVTAGEQYYFEACIKYTAQATTTGSRWVMNGPANPTQFYMRSEYTLNAAGTTVNSVAAYQLPAACNASSLAAGSVATLWGFITPSQNGTMQLQFASEITNSAITALEGSILKWQRIA